MLFLYIIQKLESNYAQIFRKSHITTLNLYIQSDINQDSVTKLVIIIHYNNYKTYNNIMQKIIMTIVPYFPFSLFYYKKPYSQILGLAINPQQIS